MKTNLWIIIMALVFFISNANADYYSATIVPESLIQGNVPEALEGGSYKQETNSLNDWPLDTGEAWGGGRSAISISNANFNANNWGGNPDTLIAFGDGGSVTLKLDGPIFAVEGQKEFGLFTAQMINGSNGSLFNGNMEVAILISSNGSDWFTLSGNAVSQNYIGSSSKLNTPTVAYNFGTLKTAWSYGWGASQADLDSLAIADFTTPMVNDDLFNGSGTDADRLALQTNDNPLDYQAIFGTSGGGNWFDISLAGLDFVEYIQLNAVNTDGGIRLDAAFTTHAATIPEPATLLLLGLGGLLIKKRGCS